MKKIMIIAAVVAFSAVANAATVTWSALATGTKLSDGSTAAGVVAYLFEGALSESVLDSIAAGTWDGSGSIASANAAANGAVMKAGVGSYENTTKTFSMVLFDAATYATATEFKYAEVPDVVFVTANKTANFTTALSNASWTAMAAVPEPTSGLLMLVGLVGLALRRKRA